MQNFEPRSVYKDGEENMDIFNRLLLVFLLAVSVLSFQGCSKAGRAEVKKQNIGDIELAYYVRGSGEPLVMIMGFRGTMTLWDPGLLEMLEKKYTLILFDNRGAGLSSDTEENVLTIAQMAEDTAALIKALGYQKTHVLGWSMGSRIAMELAFNHPDIVDTLILCSPNPGGQHQALRRPDAYEKLTSVQLSQEEGLSLIFPNTPEGQKASAAFVGRLKEAIITGTVPNDLQVSGQTVKRQVRALELWDQDNHVYEALTHIKAPTLVAGGLQDVLDQPENVRIVAGRIPFAWAAYFPDAGHYFLSQGYRHCADLIVLFTETNSHKE
jgi:pimeloyl-ACP methyl ester carboxylesterase